MFNPVYFLKKALPAPVVKVAQHAKLFSWQLFHPSPKEVPLEEQFPWSSPNVWQRVVDSYTNRSEPIIFEYGMGVSSFHHISNLLRQGGTYIAVESNLDWYLKVLNEITRFSTCRRLGLRITMAPAKSSDDSSAAQDAIINLSSETADCTVELKLRSSHVPEDSRGETDGWHEYVRALDRPCDVVIIDGRMRKECVNYALDTEYLKPDGLLALFEAGRGVDGWLGAPALTGTSDYQPEVRRMLNLGGEICDGSGLDSWPSLKYRRTMGRAAFAYPVEACFLINKEKL